MRFTYKHFDRVTDHVVFETLLRKHGDETEIVYDFFPKTGFIVYHEDVPLCAGFSIFCDNGTCINTDIVGDPTAPKEIRHAGVEYLRELLGKEAQKAGISYVMAMTSSPKLIERLLAQDYKVVQEGITHLGRKI